MTSTNSIDFNFGFYFDPQYGFFIGGNIHINEEQEKTPIEEGATSEIETPVTDAEADPEIEEAKAKAPDLKTLSADEKKALEAILSAKRGQKTEVSEKTKVNEEILYASSVYRKLSKTDKSAFIKQLTEASTHLKSLHDPSFFKATDRALRDLITHKKITAKEYQDLKKYALGKAQLDSDRSNLTRTSKTIGDSLTKLRQNKVATLQELKKFQSAQPSLASQSSSSSGGFVWKPVSESDGKLAVVLPSSLTGDVLSVSVLDNTGRMLSKGRLSGVANGDREHYRFDKTGGSYPDGATVHIELKDGSSKDVTIKDTGARYVR